MTARPSVAIVGAGPAGLAAAEILQGYPLDVVVIDEQPRPGGQILRQPPRSYGVDRWLAKPLYDRTKSVLRAVEQSPSIDWRMSSTVLGILPESPYRSASSTSSAWTVWAQSADRTYLHHVDAVLIASGCYERPLMFPGWTLPGVMGAGAIQAFIKSQQLVPGNRFVLTGSHPLQLIVADQLVAAGADVAAVLFTQSMRQAASLLRHPLTVLRNGAQLMEIARVLARLRRAGVPVSFEKAVVEAIGDEAVRGVRLARVRRDGTLDAAAQEQVDCDRVGVCSGFVASTELARAAGADVAWSGERGGWIVRHDEWHESSARGLFVAGEVTGIAGADAALEKGRIAAAGILRRLAQESDAGASRVALPARRRLERVEPFAAILARLASPPENLVHEILSDSTVLCRCESISHDVFVQRLRENPHIVSADAAKLITRAGMGMCQGRLCGPIAAQLIARERGRQMAEVGPLHAQIPVKPVQINRLRS